MPAGLSGLFVNVSISPLDCRCLQGRHVPASCRPPAYTGRVEQLVHKSGHSDHAAQTQSSLL